MLLQKDKRQHLGRSVPEIKKQEGEFAIVCSREPKAGTIFRSVLATIPPAPLVACSSSRDCGDCSTAARSSRDQRHCVCYLTGSCKCAGSHLLRLVFSCNTESNLHHSKTCRGHGGKYCGMIESHS